MEQLAATLSKSRDLGALEIDLAIDRHEDPHGLQRPFSVGNAGAFMHRLVGKVFNGMSKDYQSMAGLGSDAAAGEADMDGGKS